MKFTLATMLFAILGFSTASYANNYAPHGHHGHHGHHEHHSYKTHGSKAHGHQHASTTSWTCYYHASNTPFSATRKYKDDAQKAARESCERKQASLGKCVSDGCQKH